MFRSYQLTSRSPPVPSAPTSSCTPSRTTPGFTSCPLRLPVCLQVLTGDLSTDTQLKPSRSGPALGATVAALFYRLIKFLEYETVLAGDVDEADETPRKGRDSRMEKGAEPVEPKGGVPVEATGFGQGMLRSQDAYLENRAGPLADPSDLFKKMDHLQGMMTSILVHLEGGKGMDDLGRRLSGDTVAFRPTFNSMTEKAEATRSI